MTTLISRYAIDVERLGRRYGDCLAVDGVEFRIDRGEIFGFLGPNGAGKSTTIHMLCTMLRPTSGTARINGFDIVERQARVRQSIGVIFQEPSLDERLTGHENLRFHAMLYGLPRAVVERRSADLLAVVDLADRAADLVCRYSGGMKRRLEIARGLLHHPAVLFLDEPTAGLDPQTRRHIWRHLLTLRDQERVTMFMTTHYMEEAEHCDRIAVIDHGRIVALDTPARLKTLVGGDVVAVRTADNAQAAARLGALHGVCARHGPDAELIVETPDGDRFIPQMMDLFARGGVPIDVHSINVSRPTLEDVFIKLTGRAIRAATPDTIQPRRRQALMSRR